MLLLSFKKKKKGIVPCSLYKQLKSVFRYGSKTTLFVVFKPYVLNGERRFTNRDFLETILFHAKYYVQENYLQHGETETETFKWLNKQSSTDVILLAQHLQKNPKCQCHYLFNFILSAANTTHKSIWEHFSLWLSENWGRSQPKKCLSQNLNPT